MKMHALTFWILTAGSPAIADDCCTKRTWKGYDKGIRWERSLDAAFARAVREKKPVLYVRMLGSLDMELCESIAHVMRTLTFSDAAIANMVNDNFVPVWQNRNPKAHCFVMGRVREIVSYQGEISPDSDLTTFITDSAGGTIHYINGFYAPVHFLDELEFSITLWKEISGPDGCFRPDAVARFVALHRARADKRKIDAARFRMMTVKEIPPGFRDELLARLDLFRERDDRVWGNVEITEKSSDKQLLIVLRDRRDHLVEGMQGEYQIHRHLESAVRQRKALPSYQKIQDSLRVVTSTVSDG
jgi:hypothetical protein